MNPHQGVTTEVNQSKRGPATAAFFDFDGTLISGFSVASFLRRRFLSGSMPVSEVLAQLKALGGYGLRQGFKQGDFVNLMEQSAAGLSGVADSTFKQLATEVFQKDTSADIYPESRALVEAHLARGHTVVIVSSATQYQVTPAAEELGVGHVLCTRLEVENGTLTGKTIPPICYGKGKLAAAREFAKENNVNMDQSFFYTDGAEDIPLLEKVGFPRPLNPDKGLKKWAKREGWPVRSFDSRGLPGAKDLARTGLVYGGLIGSFAAGLPGWFLNGSKQGLKNVAISTWGDFGSAVAGLNVNTSGEEHLWSDRPAVFVFNHQSAADALIVARLLREDFTGVAKAEMKRHPIVGPVMQAMDMVFIDRSDKRRAIEALKPAVKSLREGISLVVAPEGQRSYGYRLGPFKKGAFHIAIQAGVPVVPIVIENSSDSLPKSGIIIRPATINVTVLPPVSTKAWRVGTIDQHIASIRKMFLETLGQSSARPVKLRRVK